MDLGASPWHALRLVLLPLLLPAVFASLMVVFAISIDDFVISVFLSVGAASDTIPVRIYSTARGAPTPALNALASVLLFASVLAIAVATLGQRLLTRDRGPGGSALQDLTRLDL